MLQIRLSDRDRARFGCDEWLDADTAPLTVREAMALQPLGFADPDEWREALRGTEVEGSDERKTGPEHLPAVLGLVWVALRRAGVEVRVADLDFDYDLVLWRSRPEPDAGEVGKDPSIPPTTSDA